MKLVAFNAGKGTSGVENRYRIGAFVSKDQIADLTPSVLPQGLTATEILRCYDLDTRFLSLAQDAIDKGDLPLFNRTQIRLEAPIPRPSKIICIGLNYHNHAIEVGMDIPKSPIVFSKFVTSVAAPHQPILLPLGSQQVDYEAEFAFIIGRKAKNIGASEAMNYVFGYTNFNDISARDFQFADGQWQRGKSCDTFAPFGEFVATADEIGDPNNLRIQFRLNGKTLQDSNTSELIFRIPELIEFLSCSITLEPGDIIATGTPPGVGSARKPPIFLKDGDVADVEIEGLGVLSNPVKSV